MKVNLEVVDKCVGPKRQVTTPPYILAWQATTYVQDVRKRMVMVMIDDISAISGQESITFYQNSQNALEVPHTRITLRRGTTVPLAHEFDEVLSAVNEAIQSECPINLTGKES